MARKYRKPGTLHGRFPHITRTSGMVLYVAEFSNGVVKVGMTNDQRGRLSSALTEARRIFGAVDLQQFYTTGPLSARSEAFAIEQRVLDYANQIATRADSKRREYFTGIAFDAAVAAVNNELASV